MVVSRAVLAFGGARGRFLTAPPPSWLKYTQKIRIKVKIVIEVGNPPSSMCIQVNIPMPQCPSSVAPGAAEPVSPTFERF